jgi:hypothetical protein
MEISSPLAHIFNLSLRSGSFPSALKNSRVVPVFKAGEQDLCSNYRPISLLSSISKILEKIVQRRLVAHLEYHKLLSPFQFGFQAGRNTEQNLIQVVNQITEHLNTGGYCIGLFLDLKKAFDVCSHDILLKKLAKFGVNGVERDWFESYLSDRGQRVEIDGSLSDPVILSDLSVIQGSILGPVLFNIYINDLPLATSMKTSMFADDTQCISGGMDLPALTASVNIELKKIATWFRSNRMAVNADKSNFIIFHPRGKKVDMDGLQILYDNNDPDAPFDPTLITPLERIHNTHTDKNCRSIKLLGIRLDEHMSFQANHDATMAKLNRATFMLNRVKNLIPSKTLTTLYHSLFHCHLNYCAIITSCSSKSNIEKLFKAQKKVIRIITHSKTHAHTEPLFKSLQIMTIHQIITKAKLMFMHSIYHSYAPSAFLGYWTRNADRGLNYELRHNDDFFITRIRYSFLERMPLFALPTEWNKASPNKFNQNRHTYNIAITQELLPPLAPAIPLHDIPPLTLPPFQ